MQTSVLQRKPPDPRDHLLISDTGRMRPAPPLEILRRFLLRFKTSEVMIHEAAAAPPVPARPRPVRDAVRRIRGVRPPAILLRRTERALGVLLEPAPVHFQLCQRQSFGYRRFYGGWSRDYPKADNDCLIALRRLTHINSPSPLNVVDLDSDHVFDYPWIYAVQVNTWTFTEEEAKRLHDYLMKGGFLMVDDFHGTDDWEHFMAGMRMVLARPARRGSQG